MLPRRALQFAAVFVLIAAVFSALAAAGVGLDPAPAETGNIEQDLIAGFEAGEAAYLTWGRWIDLATAAAFASLLVAAPFLPGVARARPLMVSGAAIAVVGDLIDLSRLAGIQVARFSLDNDLTTDFTAGNVFNFAINRTSTYVWVGGLVVLGLGSMILAVDSPRGRFRTSSFVLGGALVVGGVLDLVAPPQVLSVVYLAMAAAGLYWIVTALRLLRDTDQSDLSGAPPTIPDRG